MSDGKLYQHRALNDEGRPIPYARLRAYVHATTEPAIMFHAADLRSPTENPAGADAGGRFAVYLDPSKSYDLRVLSQDGDPRRANNHDYGARRRRARDRAHNL